jgi:hypothetical protein
VIFTLGEAVLDKKVDPTCSSRAGRSGEVDEAHLGLAVAAFAQIEKEKHVPGRLPEHVDVEMLVAATATLVQVTGAAPQGCPVAFRVGYRLIRSAWLELGANDRGKESLCVVDIAIGKSDDAAPICRGG